MSEQINLHEFIYRSRVMVDIETLDTADSAIILSIGAATFNALEAGTQTFYVEVSVEDQETRYPRTVNSATEEFWSKQQAEGVYFPNKGKTLLDEALIRFANWIKFTEVTEFWCKGTDFDFVILRSAYRQTAQQVPWPYNQIQDYRTLKKQLQHLVPESETSQTWPKHHALYDSLKQATHASQILGWIYQQRN